MKKKLLRISFELGEPVKIEDWGLSDKNEEERDSLYNLVSNMLGDFIVQLVNDVDDEETLHMIVPSILFDFQHLYDVMTLKPSVFTEEIFKMNFQPDSFTLILYDEDDSFGVEFTNEVSSLEVFVASIILSSVIFEDQIMGIFLADMLSNFKYSDFDDGDDYLGEYMES